MGVGSDLLKWLGVERPPDTPDVVDSIASVLDRLDHGRARYVAAFAYLLGRVADADHTISAEERNVIVRLVGDEGSLGPGEATAVVSLALDEFRRVGGTHNLIVARAFTALATLEQRLGLLRCLFAVSAADQSVVVRKDKEIKLVSLEQQIDDDYCSQARTEVPGRLG